ncbi:hypothetical protein CFB52_022915 [Burkholderia sp. AU18528]|nr:hypothetical protein CFB52_022915 [Burkholderia sp. AU18528]RQX81595.1 hypothetical protein DF034_18245 [Burkholderia anthina]
MARRIHCCELHGALPVASHVRIIPSLTKRLLDCLSYPEVWICRFLLAQKSHSEIVDDADELR